MMKRILIVVVAATVAAGAFAYSSLVAQSGSARGATPSNEWPTYGHDPGGQRFSPLTQVTPANVDRLEVAWVYHMRPAPSTDAAVTPGAGQGRGGGRGGSGFASSETTPIVVDGLMYLTTPYGRVVALDSTTG